MKATGVQVRRLSVVSARPFEEVVDRLTANIGRPDMAAFNRDMKASRTTADLQKVVQAAIGPSGFMEFIRFDLGEVLSKEQGAQAPRILRFVVGNPLVMKEMARTAPDAASYAPVTILVDQRADGVHLSYDSMASLIAPYASEAALSVARKLDAKVEHLIETAAG
jgi:uncharacterized protein (DUF302 family)